MPATATVPGSSSDKASAQRRHLKTHAIINLRAGTVLGLEPDAVRETVETAFATRGHDITVECIAPDSIGVAIARAASRDIDVLIMGGGDGTVRTAARHLMRTGKALGILPLGTMNRLARDLGVPLGLGDAATFLATATPSKIDVAKVNGSIFLCNSVMGPTLHYSVGRARLRGRPVTDSLPKYFALIQSILSSRRQLSIIVDQGGERLRIRALSVAVTNNSYDESTTWLRRSKLDDGKLTMYVSKHRSGWGLAKALARALVGRWHGDPEMAKLTGSHFVIYSRDRRKRLSNDGEIAKYDTPLVYEIEPKALTVLTASSK